MSSPSETKPPKFAGPEDLLQMMEAWLHTPASYFNKNWPFFDADRIVIMQEYDCDDEAEATAILFAVYADEILG